MKEKKEKEQMINNYKSLKGNAILNGIRQIVVLLAPLLVVTYVTRIIGPDNYGRLSYASHFVSYFTLLSSFGISSYAIREGSAIKKDKEKCEKLYGEIFGFNIISTIFSLLSLSLILVLSQKVKDYGLLIVIYACSIPFNTFSFEWIFHIYEDFKYVTIRTIVIEIIQVILVFVLVRSPSDTYLYAIIGLCTSILIGVSNLFSSRRYCKFLPIINRGLLKHLKNIFIMFACELSIVIYVSSDVMILGNCCSDEEVGLYSLAANIYIILKKLIYSVGVVSLPRVTAYLSKGEMDKYNKCARNVIDAILVALIPAMVGLFSISGNAIYIVSGPEYLGATNTLRILSVAMFFAVMSSILTSVVILPHKYEKYLLLATVSSAALNIILNLILIPYYGIEAAACTTLFSELVAFMILLIVSYKNAKLRVFGSFKNSVSLIVGAIPIYFICLVVNILVPNNVWINTALAVTISIIIYFGILFLMKNEVLIDATASLIHKIRRKGNE